MKNSSSAAQILEDAYVYAYPLVLLDLIREAVTNAEEPSSDRAPLNQLFHTRELATPAMTSLTRPNVDTLYSQAYLDLGEEPMVLLKPGTGRYCSIQTFDGYSTTPVVLGSGGLGGRDSATYVLSGPRFAGPLPDDLPADLVHVPMPTDLVWLLIRTRSLGPDDLDEAHAVQDQLRLHPLSARGSDLTPPRGTHDPARDFVPLERIREMSPQEFFTRFNRLAVTNPGTSADQPALERFGPLGIGAALDFDLDALDEEARERAGVLGDLISREFAPESGPPTVARGWTYMHPSVGEFGTRYPFRARVAQNGFANPVHLTAYPYMHQEAPGVPLTGGKDFTLHFEPGELPPHREGGWWSLSAYAADGRFIDNELDRYAIGGHGDLELGPDGSLDIVISAQHPGAELERTWLPVHRERFSLVFRIYLPKDEVSNLDWLPPALTPRP